MNINEVLRFFRAVGLMHTVDKWKFWAEKYKLASKNKLFRSNNPDVVLPPDYVLFESFGMDYDYYYVGGRITAQDIIDKFSAYISLESINILDWGCGPARVVRHIPDILSGKQCRIFGTDYNPTTIDWCKKNISGVEFSLNQLSPPLPFESDLFHALYGISIFTHLSEEKHKQWFDELMRVCRQGAIIFLTTHGEVFKERMTLTERKAYENGELVVRANVTEGHRVYVGFQPAQFMMRLFSGKCEVLEHRMGSKQEWGIEQDEWVLRKL